MSAPAAAIAGIDHALVGVADLERAADAWRRLGFATTPRGRHVHWGTANVCVMFADDYVELLGIVDAGRFVNGLDRFLEDRGEGLMGVALSTPDADALHASLGADASLPPADLSRLFDRPEGTVEPRFRLVHFTGDAMPALSAFAVQHLTPDLLRRPDWLDHPNGAHAIEGVTVVVDDPAELTPAYAGLFGRDRVHEGGARLDVKVGRHALRFLSPARFARRYPGVEPPGVLPGACVMTVLVRDLAATAAFLAARGVRGVPVAGERIVVHPGEATGVVVEFALS